VFHKDYIIIALFAADEDPFLNGAAPLFDLCQSVFESVAKEMEELEDEVEEVEEDVDESKRASSIQETLRQLLNAARRKVFFKFSILFR
jgi:Mg2+ and Co2+ transporter CorA